MKISIIGGAGFLGLSLFNYLSDRGNQFKLIDTKDRFKILKKNKILNNSKKFIVNYKSEKSIQDSLKNTDVLINFFTLTSPQTSMSNYYLNTIKEMKINSLIFKYSKIFNIKKIIFISSGGAIYGQANKFPINEKSETNPISAYGLSKLYSEKNLLFYKDIDSVILRIANAYGPLQFRGSKIGFISNAIDRIINNKVIKIWGDLNITKDYVYIDDINLAIEKIIYKQKIKSNIYNLSNSKGTNIKKIIKIIEDTLEKKAKVEFYPLREYDIKKNILCNKKFSKDFNWKPKIKIHTGINKMIKFYNFNF